MDCTNCGHSNGWHLFSDGPHRRKCNKPQCTCDELKED